MSSQLVCVFLGVDGLPKLTVNHGGRIHRWTLTDEALTALAKDVIETISKRAKSKLATEKPTE